MKIWNCKGDPNAIIIEVPFNRESINSVMDAIRESYEAHGWVFRGRARVGNSMFIKFSR